VSEASKLSTMRGRPNLNQLESQLPGERAVSEASKLSTMRGAYALSEANGVWSPLPDLNPKTWTEQSEGRSRRKAGIRGPSTTRNE
jgi:hypothetical protein